MLVKNLGIACTTLELCNVFYMLKTHEDSMCEVLAIGVLDAACIQDIHEKCTSQLIFSAV
jgi:hypothetical protein